MGAITISDLRPAGSALLSDSESFLNDLSANEIDNLRSAGWYIRFGFDNRGILVQLSWARR